MPLYARLNESSCSTSEQVPLIEFCKFPTPVCKMRGILPTWQQAVGSTWMLVHEGDGESVSRDLRIDQVLECGDRGGGMIDMLRKESVNSESVVLGPSLSSGNSRSRLSLRPPQSRTGRWMLPRERVKGGLETEYNNWWPCKGSSGHRISESTMKLEFRLHKTRWDLDLHGIYGWCVPNCYPLPSSCLAWIQS